MSDSRLRLAALTCGILGPVLLSIYFAAPVFTGWPFAGASPSQISEYAAVHERLFFAGAWLQGTGALLSVLFFLILADLSRAASSLAKSLVVVGAALLLGVVLIEGAFLITVPLAARTGDLPTVATTFMLSNGVFVRVFPIVPAPLLFVAAGMVLASGRLLRPAFSISAFVLGILFVLAGVAAIFHEAGFVAAIVLSVVQQVWIVAAAIATWRGR